MLSEPEWPKVVLAALGILGMSIAFPTVYLYSAELFPTVVRNVGVGSSSMCARFGSMVAPYTTSLASSKYFQFLLEIIILTNCNSRLHESNSLISVQICHLFLRTFQHLQCGVD
jgi:MFS family permease